jgi:Mn2+/Fe2+ NRAMP family transporter
MKNSFMNWIIRSWRLLGPGMMYAGAAVGVSHLVQSTRAGSDYGWTLWWVILFSNFIKYPFFQFGPRYAAATGNCLLHGYRHLGNYALIIFITITILTMFAIQAAVTVVTAGLCENVIPLGLSAPAWSVILLLSCGLMLIWDNYQLISRVVKGVILLLTVATLVCLVMAKRTTAEMVAMPEFSWSSTTDLLFVVALMGWMPAPIDISVWHSGWSKERDQVNKTKTSLKDQLFDFNVGYIGTALLAICFLGLGAIIMHRSGREFSGSAAGFAKDLIELFTQTLGPWSYPFILTAAFATMFSTTLTLLDAFPRSLRTSFNLLLKTQPNKWQYNFWLLITIAGTSALLFFFMQNMKGMVDLATTISFVVAPVLAILNTKAILSSEVAGAFRPGRGMVLFAGVGIAFLSIFSLYFIWIRFF